MFTIKNFLKIFLLIACFFGFSLESSGKEAKQKKHLNYEMLTNVSNMTFQDSTDLPSDRQKNRWLDFNLKKENFQRKQQHLKYSSNMEKYCNDQSYALSMFYGGYDSFSHCMLLLAQEPYELFPGDW